MYLPVPGQDLGCSADLVRRPALDLVAVSPDGGIAAFCICWLGASPGRPPRGQIEPLGVAPAYRRSGLGRAILEEGLRRLGSHGAEEVFVETDSYRNAAYGLYESVGFRVIRDVLVFRKNYAG
jgi:ribosomal protein S18 acetylase RimI-like enzyme